MDSYEILLFLHIAAAIVWIGSGLLLNVQAFRADRARDTETIERVLKDASELSKVLFVPASLAVLVLGVLLTLDGPWEFSELWIVLGLVGYFATFVTGLAILEPGTRRVRALMEREGGMSPAASAEARRILILARIDLVVLFLVVADMALKPTGDDVGTLVLMGAILVAAVAYFTWRSRVVSAVDAPSGATA